MGSTPHTMGLIAVAAVFLIGSVLALRKFVRSGGMARGAWRFDAKLLERAREAEMGKGLRLTKEAAERMRAMARENRMMDVYVLVSAKPGGPARAWYQMDLMTSRQHPPPAGARLYRSLGIPIACDEQSFAVGKLNGAAIDWHITDDGGGFWFDVPGMPRPF